MIRHRLSVERFNCQDFFRRDKFACFVNRSPSALVTVAMGVSTVLMSRSTLMTVRVRRLQETNAIRQ